ncbi:hypothetical protein PI125_g11620 [Phytophthora idaei]|nr:hypothetical protein PI125_g11620 [Phytophthora idaei]KAG3137787.1 hypothetical protein PI126_g17214 [Phytophthora idaei]
MLCTVAEEALVPPWRDESTRRGARALPENFQGADTGTTTVTDKNQFAGLPMALFEKNCGYNETSFIATDPNKITLTNVRLRERPVLWQESPVQSGK